MLNATAVFGQSKMIVNDSRFIFYLSGNLNKPNTEGLLTIDLIEIKDTKSNKRIQNLNPDSKFVNPKNDDLFKILDLNYDGINDFILLSTNGQYNDVIYDFYIFDSTASQFIKWEKEFNEGANAINVRPSFDRENKTITTYWHNTDTFQKTSTFKFLNGNYQLIEEYNQELDKETDYKYVITTHKKMIEGKLRLVELEMIPLTGED